MSKILKFLLISLASVLLLVVLIIGGIFLFVDPNDFKGDITTAVYEATGRELTIEGDISLSLYPWLGLSLGKTEISNAVGFGDIPFASIKKVDIKVSVLPLFQQRLEMRKIRLHGLQANLAKDTTGRSNWDDLVTPPTPPVEDAAQAETIKKPEKPGRPKPTKVAGTLAALAIDGLELENAHLDWNDQQNNQHIMIDKLTLHTGPLALPAPVDISLSLDVQMNQPEIRSHVEFKGQVVANLAEQIISLNKLQLGALGVALSGHIDIKDLNTTPEASGQLKLANVSPRELASRLGIQLPETIDAAVLSNANANIEFSANSQQANVKKLSITLDDTELTGTASVKNFTAPVIRFNLDANSIDVDRYLPPPADKPSSDETPPAPAPGSTATGETQLPLEPLRTLDIDGDINFGKLKIVGAQLTDMKLGINGKSGKLRLHPVKASLYNGQYNGDIGLDVRTDTPKVTVNEKLTTVNIGPLLNDVLGKQYLTGTANITAQLNTTGSELESIKQSLNGKAAFSFKDGKILGVNIVQKLREDYAKFKKLPAPPKTENETDFAEMSGTAVITSGIIQNSDLNAKSPLLRVTGKGSVDLPGDRIKYRLKTALVGSIEGQSGKEIEELKSVIIPIKVTGSLTKPKFVPDVSYALRERVKTAVEKEKKKVKEDIEKQLEEKKEEFVEDLKKKLKIKF